MENEEKKKVEKGVDEKGVGELEKKLLECQKLKEEYLNGWKRARADFLNYKKEEVERIEGFLKLAIESLLLKLLPVIDNFEISLKNEPREGFANVKKQLDDFMREEGVEEIKTIGERFDPAIHQVVQEVKASDKEQGIVVEEIQKGYKINGRLLRPAKVKVAG